MAISAAQVKELRDKTGAGMMDCKKALTEADGDFNKAIEILRKKGASVAAKRADRTASEGVVKTELKNNDTEGVILEVNCETDFVAKSDDFTNFADSILKLVVEKEPKNNDELMNLNLNGSTVSDELTNIIGKIGEKIEISRFAVEKTENGLVVDYIHHGSKLGVLIVAENADSANEELKSSLKEIAMQVAAMNPSYVSREDVPEDVKAKEMEIYKEVAKKEGKPEQVLERIAEGKLNKYYEENCLLEQPFVKDNSKTVGDLIKEFNEANSANVRIKLFHRYHINDENKQ